MSENAELAKALSAAQAEIMGVKMDAVNPYYKSKYATLGAIIEAAKPTLDKYRLALAQFPVSDDNRIGVRTILLHESGQFMEDTIFVEIPENASNPAQEAGKIITYLRRYSYAAVLGMYADEDTDANTAQNPPKSLRKAEPETKTSTQALIATRGGKRSWPADLVTRLVNEGLANAPKHAVNILNQSPFVDELDLDYTEVLEWARNRKVLEGE